MENLLKVLELSVQNKPPKGADCNHCGYCCLTEVCVVGQEFTGKSIGPCELLKKQEGEEGYKCTFGEIVGQKVASEILGFNTGCCAETQREAIVRIMGAEE